MPKPLPSKWQFKARFRRRAFGWRSRPAIQRLREALAEIRKAARQSPVIGAEGAVTLIERLSPALEQVDSSSGAIGSAVHGAIEELAALIAGAPAPPPVREAWIERLWQAFSDDEVPYLEGLADHWGAICGSKERASAWADGQIWITTQALSPDPNMRGYYKGATACLSALHRADRFQELLAIVERDPRALWHYRVWGVRALAGLGRKAEAIQFAEASRGNWTSDLAVDGDLRGDPALLGARRGGLPALRRPRRPRGYLPRHVPVSGPAVPAQGARRAARRPRRHDARGGGEVVRRGKEAGLYGEALALAERTPTDPKTLTRAARDHVKERPEFVLGAGLAALRWLAAGCGYEITGADVWSAYANTMAVARALGREADVRAQVRALVDGDATGFMAKVLGSEIGAAEH